MRKTIDKFSTSTLVPRRETFEKPLVEVKLPEHKMCRHELLQKLLQDQIQDVNTDYKAELEELRQHIENVENDKIRIMQNEANENYNDSFEDISTNVMEELREICEDIDNFDNLKLKFEETIANELQDSEVVYSIKREPTKRIFYIDVGKMPDDRVKEHIEKVKEEIRTRRIPDVFMEASPETHPGRAYKPVLETWDIIDSFPGSGKGSRVEKLPDGNPLEMKEDYYFGFPATAFCSQMEVLSDPVKCFDATIKTSPDSIGPLNPLVEYAKRSTIMRDPLMDDGKAETIHVASNQGKTDAWEILQKLKERGRIAREMKVKLGEK